MSDSVVAWLSIAVLLFWAMGAHNRLMRLRFQSIEAFAALENLLNQYILMVKANVTNATGSTDFLDDIQENNNACSDACVDLTAAVDQFSVALKLAHAKPLNGLTILTLRTAFETLCLCWTRLRELQPNQLCTSRPDTLQLQWEHVTLQAEIASTEFNRQVLNYNEAIHQFPALLLAWIFGFKEAKPL